MNVLNTTDLAERHCASCVNALDIGRIQMLSEKLKTRWQIVNNQRLRQEFIFDSFMDAMVFVNDIAALAEDEGHHPDMAIRHRRVVLELTTHSVEGLSVNDFILARKIEMCC